MHTLEKRLNYTFENKELLERALYHSSYANEHRGGFGSNERLEFLGDAVLGMVTADYLFHRHPDLPEGDLTRIRAALVCEQSLHEVAQRLGLGEYIKLGHGEELGGGRKRPSILADATESPQYHLIRKPGVINQVMRNTTNLVLAQKLRPVELVPGSYKNILSPSVTIFSHSIISISNQSIRVPASTGIHFSFQITPDERCRHKIHRMFLHLIV